MHLSPTTEGKTIVIVDSFGSPTIQSDMQTFDAQMGLPKVKLRVIQPEGAVPPYDPNNATMGGWAIETTLDVEVAHGMAPGASILLVETPVAETEGVTAFVKVGVIGAHPDLCLIAILVYLDLR